ncbi:MAG: response regulator [Pirellulales bacterium]|nr:response regulator [Pirellulales bacterium]
MSSQLLEEPLAVQTGRPQRSILIVDDDKEQTEVLATRLTRLGYRTLQAHRGHSGLAMARQHRPDLVILDLRLPDADGFDICTEIDGSPPTCGTPIIIVSGMEGADIIRRSWGAGCRYYVRKPYDPNALLVLIEQEIGRV